MSITIPHDWRDPPTSYEETDAVGWYRRNFTLTSDTLQLFTAAPTNPAIALGVVACSDTTYVNCAAIGCSRDPPSVGTVGLTHACVTRW